MFFTIIRLPTLFRIERRCRSQSHTNRTQVYSHLSAHLPCTRQTLMSRAKKVSAEAFDYELQTALSNIRVIIDVSKTRVFANFQKLMDEAKLKFESGRQNGVESSPIQLPRKVFPFDKQLRKQLKCAITAKLKLYDQIGFKSHTVSLKDYLYEFLDKEIKPIFPKGWMTLEILKHRVKWIEQILPAEPKQLPHSSQSGPQSTSQSVQSSAQINQISPQSQTNKVQTQQSSHEKLNKQPMTTEKINSKNEIDSSVNNVTLKSKFIQNSHQMHNKVSDSLSEGLVSKFMSSKETKNNNNTLEPINLSSIDLSTKARSSPKPFNVPTSSMTPMNLKTSPNSTTVKSSSSSPSMSPMTMNSILGNYKNDKTETMSRGEACLTKVIEQSLGDYPNSSVSSTSNNHRNAKTSLPQTQLPFNEMFAKSFNSTPKKESTPEVIEIASSPEPYTKPPTSKAQPTLVKQTPHSTPQQYSQQKASVSSSSMSYMRISDASKKKYASSGATSLLHSSSAQKEQEMRAKVDQSKQHNTSTPIRSTPSDTSLTITPIQSKANDNSVSSSKQNSSQSSRLSNASNVITSSVSNLGFNFDQRDSAYMEQYMRYLQNVNYLQNPIRYIDPSVYASQNSQNIFFPYATNTSTTSHRTGSKDKQ